jgi:thiamine biosynthesis lipoprotein ApbE
MRLKLICAVLVGLLLVVAPGCGSKKKSATTKAATTTQVTTTEATTTEATTAQSTTSTSGGTTFGSSECAKLVAAEQTVAKVTSGTVPGDIATQIAKLNELAKIAPAAVRSDFAELAKAASQFSKLHVQAGKTMTAAQLQQLMAGLDIAKLTQASTHLSSWAQANCTAK